MTALSGFGDTFELDVLKLIFNGTTISNIAQNANTSPLTNLYVALHTADPTEAGDQTSSEIAYTNYARAAVSRDTGGWTANNPTTNVAAINFPQCGANGANATHVSIGVAANGASKIIAGGALTAPLTISNGVTPSFSISGLSIGLD